MANLSTTTESILGIPGLARAGRQISGVDSRQALNLQEGLLDGTARILERNNRIQAFLTEEKARRAGLAVMDSITELDPASSDYLIQRNRILSERPEASLDKTAMAVLGLQEDIYRDASHNRQQQEAWDREQKMYEERLSHEDETLKNRYAAQKELELSKAVSQLSSNAQTIFRKYQAEGVAPQDALAEASAWDEDQSLQADLLEAGIPPKDIQEALTENGRLGKLGAAYLLGQAEIKRKSAKEDLDKSKALQDEINSLMDELSDPLNIPTEARKKTIMSEVQTFRSQLRALRGIGPGGSSGGTPDPFS